VSIDKIYNYVNQKENNTPNMLNSYKKELKKVEKEIEQTIDLLMSGYRHDSIKSKMDKLEEDKKELELLIVKTELESNRVVYSKEEIRKFMYNFKYFKNMKPKEQKKVIDMFVHKVLIYEDRYDMSILNNPMKS